MKYRKKPVVINAIQWHGDMNDTIRAFIAANQIKPGILRPKGSALKIATLEGTMLALMGDWLICGVHGELYPCKPDIFAETYEPAEFPESSIYLT